MKKRISAMMIFAVITLVGCSSGYKDGTYEGKSSPDENGDYSVINITLKDNLISDCKFRTYEANGEEKGEEYAKSSEEAKVAVASVAEYEKKLKETGDIAEVDAISGATINYNQLNEAVYDALAKAS
ncbi:MAG: FMN-binding protein [Firmicutes bacterium]|nr:FMN-binding protein [Bacillota bacterium]